MPRAVQWMDAEHQPCVPYLDSLIITSCVKPMPVTIEPDGSHIAAVTVIHRNLAVRRA